MQPSIAFGSAGMVYAYQIGAADFIREHFDMEQVACTGVSAGCTSVMSIALGVTVDQHWRVLHEVSSAWKARRLGPFFQSTEEWMVPYLRLLDTPEFSSRLQCKAGLIGVGVTTLPLLRSRVISEFATIRDFCYAVTCSERIWPFYRCPGRIDGAWVIDGAFSTPFVKSGHGVTISPWPDSGADIHPTEHWTWSQILRPPSQHEFFRQYRLGYNDAYQQRCLLTDLGFQATDQPRQQIMSAQ